MKININNPAIIKSLASAAALSKKSSTSDIYLKLRIAADKVKGMKITVLCENSITFEQTFTPEEVAIVEGGEVYVNSADFARVIKNFTEGPCRFETKAKGEEQNVVFRISRTQKPVRRVSLPVYCVNLPTVPDSNGSSITLNAELLRFAVKDVFATIGFNPHQPILSTERLTIGDGIVSLESTDGNRCSRASYEDSCVGNSKFALTIPKAVCKLISSFIKVEKPATKKAKEEDEDDEDESALPVNTVKINVNREKKAMSIEIGNIKITSLMVHGEYPNTARVYNLDETEELCRVDADVLKTFAKNIITVVSSTEIAPPITLLGFTKEKAIGRCASTIATICTEINCNLREDFPYGDATVIVGVESEDLFVIGMNPFFISDAVKNLDGEITAFAFSSIGQMHLYGYSEVGETQVEQVRVIFPVRTKETDFESVQLAINGACEE